MKITEDCFEALMGSLSMLADRAFSIGTGYRIVYDIMHTLLDQVNIDLDYLAQVDGKTIIKEHVKDYKENAERFKVEEYDKLNNQVHTAHLVIKYRNTGKILYSGKATASNKKEAEKKVGLDAALYMNKLGLLKYDINLTMPEICAQKDPPCTTNRKMYIRQSPFETSEEEEYNKLISEQY